MAVTKRTRFEVLKRDNYTCRYCRSADNPLTIDHVAPSALGGSDSPDNLVACCKDCNAGKTSTAPDATLVADVSEDAVRWARAMQEAAEVIHNSKAAQRAYVNDFVGAWGDWTYGPGDEPLPVPDDWEASIIGFYKAGLPLSEMLESVRIACGNRRIDARQTWRYMCGVAWNKLAELQEVAKSLLEVDASDG